MPCPKLIGQRFTQAAGITGGGQHLIIWVHGEDTVEYNAASLNPTGRRILNEVWGGPAESSFVCDDNYNIYYWSDTYGAGFDFIDLRKRTFPGNVESTIYTEATASSSDYRGAIGFNPYDGWIYHMRVTFAGSEELRRFNPVTEAAEFLWSGDAYWDQAPDMLSFTSDGGVWWCSYDDTDPAGDRAGVRRYDPATDTEFKVPNLTDDGSQCPIPYDDSSVLIAPADGSIIDGAIHLRVSPSFSVGHFACTLDGSQPVEEFPNRRPGTAELHTATNGITFLVWPTEAGQGEWWYQIGDVRVPWLRMRQRDDVVRVNRGYAKNRPSSMQQSTRAPWRNTYL